MYCESQNGFTLLWRFIPEVRWGAGASSPRPAISPRASAKRRSISARVNKVLSEPVRRERPVPVRDVVADVVALLEQPPRRVRRRVGDLLRLLPAHEPVVLAR